MTSEFAFRHWRPGFDERLIIRSQPPFASVGDTDSIRHQNGGVRECGSRSHLSELTCNAVTRSRVHGQAWGKGRIVGQCGLAGAELHVTSSLQLSSLDSLAWAARSIWALIAPPMRNANPVTYSQINRIITSATDP
jgi:hypothetical protein